MDEKERTFDETEKILQTLKEKNEKIQDSIEYVNLDELQMEEPSIISQKETINSIFSAKPSFQVVCAQSGYMAKVSALMYKDIVALLNSNLSNYEYKKEIYKIVYSKITGFSAANWRPTIDEWLKATSLGDIETLLYGIYSATFQDKSTIKFQCPYCGDEVIVTVDNKQLVRVEDKQEMIEQTNAINKDADTLEKIKEFSLVTNKKNNIKSIKLPDSHIIFSIKMPTLYKTLTILKEFSDEKLANLSADALNILLSTDKVLIQNNETKKYSEIENKSDIIGIINLLSIDDISTVKNVVTKMLNDKHISYYLQNQKCKSCNRKINKVPMDIESLLFFQISEKQLS